jgi:hypothetical protein
MLLAGATGLAALSGPSVSGAQDAAPNPVFTDMTAAAGISFVHKSSPEKKYILESMSGGVAMLDFNNDGLLDIYLVNSLTVATAEQPESARSALYENRGDMTFVDVTEGSGLAHPGWGVGTCVADVDGDGWQDLYITQVGQGRLYRNNQDGTFTDIAPAAGVTGDKWGAGCGFADYDRDGDLDLFVSRYVEVDLNNLPEFGVGETCQYLGIAVQCGPRGLPGTGDLLFRNEGDGTFTDVSVAAGVDDPGGYFGLGIAWFDANEDGWPDLFVANDSTPNFLYMNQADGTFQEMAFPMGVAVSADGGEQGGMGVAIGDYDNSGRRSIYVTNFAGEYNALYRNDGLFFSDVSFRSRTGASSLPYVGWGTAFMDFDNDGLLDLLATNGHVYPQMQYARLGASAPYRQRKLLYRNVGEGSFEEVTAERAPVLLEERVSRGMATGDLDNDGRLDVIVNDLDGAAQLLRNTAPDPGNWLLVDLVGAAPNTDAIGAVVRVVSGDRTQTSNVRSGTSYLSQDDMRQHFGLGAAERADRIEVLWPDGTTTVRESVAANQIVRIEQQR